MSLLNTAAGETLRHLQCERSKGTRGAKQGTGSTETVSTLGGLDMCPSSCRGVYKGTGSSYFFGFQKV